jgi:hypothetical protein
LLKLGFTLSERTVSRYLRQRGRWPERRQSWLTFLRNHREVILAMDFFTVPTATFRILYVWFAIRHSRREFVHWSVTETPTAPWVVQQLREAFPFDEADRVSRYWCSTGTRSSPRGWSPRSPRWRSSPRGQATRAHGRMEWLSDSWERYGANCSTTPS